MDSENRRARGVNSQHRALASDSYDDDELRKAIEASEKEHGSKERERRRREEELVAQEAADEAAAIADSTRLARIGLEAQKREEAAADAELERILKLSAVEAEKNKATQEEELARLHANFGNSPGNAQHGRSSVQSPTSRASNSRQRASSDVIISNSAGSTSEQRRRARTTAQNPTSQGISVSNASSEGVRPRGGDLLSRALQSVRRPFGRSSSISSQQPARQNASVRLAETQTQDVPTPPAPTISIPREMPHLQDRGYSDRIRHGPSPPLQTPDPPVRRHSERALPPRNSVEQRFPSSRRPPQRAASRRERLDAQMQEALNSSHRYARMDERYGDSHSHREEEMIRRAMEQSLGDAPPPPDPSEGLLDPPPGYEDIHRDKVLDPRRYTTTNIKGNEPGYQQRITPEIRKVMQNWLAELQKFDAESKAAGKDQPPANNSFAKKRPEAETTSAATASNAESNGADDLQTLLGGRRPAPAPPMQDQAVAANAFMSRMPGLATDARTRIPTARPWDNAFSRLPTARPAVRVRERERRSGL